MAEMKVNSVGLSLRSRPSRSRNARKAFLLGGSTVQTLGEPNESGWIEVDTDAGHGFVASRRLRQPLSEKTEALVSASMAQWQRFDMGQGKEFDAPFNRFVGEMWASIGLQLDGNSVDRRGRPIPWSAAFISFVMRQAEYDDFLFSASHANYIRDAILSRIDEKEDKSYWAFRLNEHKPQIGDMVARWRSNNELTLDQVLEPNRFFPSHCDIVVATESDRVHMIGGNLSDTVRTDTCFLTPDGFIDDNRPGQTRIFAVLRNNN